MKKVSEMKITVEIKNLSELIDQLNKIEVVSENLEVNVIINN